MRRLAKQSRDDTYKSLKDYQQITSKTSKRLAARDNWSIALSGKNKFAPERPIAWGGYFASDEPSVIKVTIEQEDVVLLTQDIELDNQWRRVGGISIATKAGGFTLKITGAKKNNVDVWGLSAGAPSLPLSTNTSLTTKDFEFPHLMPETYYLDHGIGIGLDIEDDACNGVVISDGRNIQLKKCSYCGRMLPIDSNRLGVLSFHKHNAKVSRHQNECRACKKWRINNQFNPIRTPDQLHESSVITRERKILLREPERLQIIKERDGRGLRSQIWEKFEKKCFRCSVSVDLKGFQLDHTRPLAYLWPIDEFATCLCATCNNEKKEKFPIDFYGEDELARLSAITKLPIEELKIKSVNPIELDRILTELPRFARKWDARTFFAINRKVNELRPEINIARLLEVENPTLYKQLLSEYSSRPSIDNDE